MDKTRFYGMELTHALENEIAIELLPKNPDRVRFSEPHAHVYKNGAYIVRVTNGNLQKEIAQITGSIDNDTYLLKIDYITLVS